MEKLPNFKNFSIFNKHVNQALTYIFHQAKQSKLDEIPHLRQGGPFFSPILVIFAKNRDFDKIKG